MPVDVSAEGMSQLLFIPTRTGLCRGDCETFFRPLDLVVVGADESLLDDDAGDGILTADAHDPVDDSTVAADDPGSEEEGVDPGSDGDPVDRVPRVEWVESADDGFERRSSGGLTV